VYLAKITWFSVSASYASSTARIFPSDAQQYIIPVPFIIKNSLQLFG